MADLEKIMAETSKSYDASRKALNDQINAISGDLAAQQQRINAQYAQQGKDLDNQRNWQAQASSMAASRNGGSFGGSAEIANKKYYQQAYVPAVTQMQTNQANDISSAESQANQNRLNLENTLAQLNDEANRVAIQRFDAAVQAEKDEAYRQAQLREQQRQHDAQMALQRAQLAQDQEYKRWLQQQEQKVQTQNRYGIDNDLTTDTSQIWYKDNNTGASVRFGTYAKSKGGDYKGLLQKAAQMGDNDSRIVLDYLKRNPGATISYMGGGKQYYGTRGMNALENRVRDSLNRLGIKVSGLSQG